VLLHQGLVSLTQVAQDGTRVRVAESGIALANRANFIACGVPTFPS